MHTRTVQLAPGAYEYVESRTGDTVIVFAEEGDEVYVAGHRRSDESCTFDVKTAVYWKSDGSPLELPSDGGGLLVWNAPNAAAFLSIGVYVAGGAK